MSKSGRRPSDGAENEPQYRLDEARQRRAWLCAIGCAVVAVPLPAVLLHTGLHAGLTSIMLFAVGQFVIGWGLNHKALGRAVDRSFQPDDTGRVAGLPLYRYLVAGFVALVVFLLAPLCLFNRDIEANHDAARPANWAARRQVLHDEDARLRAVIAEPLPKVDSDPEFVSLHKQLDQAREDWPRIRDEVICESDGRCGSGLVGKKQRYEEKVKRRVDLQRDIDMELPKAIAGRTKVVQDNIAAAKDMKLVAEHRSSEITSELSMPPQWSDRWYGRWQALDDVARPGWMVGVAVFVALLAGLLYLLGDVLLVRWMARRICTSGNESPRTGGEGSPAGDDENAPREALNGSPQTMSDGASATPRKPTHRAESYADYIERHRKSGHR